MADNTTKGNTTMARYRLIQQERRTLWVGDGVKIKRTNPQEVREGTLEEVTAAAVEEVLETLRWEIATGDLAAEEIPGEREIARGVARDLAAVAEGALEDCPLDAGGVWCLTLEEVTN